VNTRERGTMPAGADNNESVGLATAASIGGSYTQSVTVGANGLITVKYGPGSGTFGQKANSHINGKELALSPVTGAGSISWSCKGGATPVDPKYLPSSCRNS